MSQTAWNTVNGKGTGAEFELFFGYPDEKPFATAVELLADDKVASRIAAKDPSLWGPAAEEESAKRLGWVALSETSRPLVTEISTLQVELREKGLSRIVLCGMGGSSLAPEVICAAAGVELDVLDSSDPDFVRTSLEDRLSETVVVVSSKSGGTVETDSQRRAFEKAFTDAGIDPAERIVVVTDPGSPLEESARGAGYRVFLADPTVGGRFSALTAFGLVPSGLAGADIAGLLDEAEAIRPALETDSFDNPGLRLGALLGVANLAGVDKLVIAEAGAPYPGFGDWAEQLVAESTGKDGKGILPVVVEGLDAPNFQPSTPDELLCTGRPRLRVRLRPSGLRLRGVRRRDARRADAAVGVRHLRRRPADRDQPVRPAGRRERESRGAVDARRRRQPADSGLRRRRRSRSTPPRAGCRTAPPRSATPSPRSSTTSTPSTGTSPSRRTSTVIATRGWRPPVAPSRGVPAGR